MISDFFEKESQYTDFEHLGWNSSFILPIYGQLLQENLDTSFEVIFSGSKSVQCLTDRKWLLMHLSRSHVLMLKKLFIQPRIQVTRN